MLKYNKNNRKGKHMTYKKYKARCTLLFTVLAILTLFIAAFNMYIFFFTVIPTGHKLLFFTTLVALIFSLIYAIKTCKDQYIELREGSVYFHLFTLKYKGNVPSSIGFDGTNPNKNSQAANNNAFMPKIIEVNYSNINSIDVKTLPLIGITSILISCKNQSGKILIPRRISSLYEMTFELCKKTKLENPKAYISPLLIAELESKSNI